MLNQKQAIKTISGYLDQCAVIIELITHRHHELTITNSSSRQNRVASKSGSK